MRELRLTAADWEHVVDFIEETEALIDADDGTLFPIKYLDKFEVVKEILGYGNEE